MFTGIIEEVGAIESSNSSHLRIGCRLIMEGLDLGSSISVNGACLTVTSLEHGSFGVDIAPETIRRTNLGSLKAGEPVNLERSLPVYGRLGGHIVQGHVDAKGRILSEQPEGDAVMFKFQSPKSLMPYIVEKGFIAVDGISLTVVHKGVSSFTVSVIPYTLGNTVLKDRRKGDPVNLEVDIVAKYVESILGSHR